METRCVHCELGNELLNITETTSESCLGCAMVQAFSRQPLATYAWARSQASPRVNGDGQRFTATGFFPGTSVFPCQYHSNKAPHPISSHWCSYQKTKEPSLGTSKKQCSLGNRKAFNRPTHFFRACRQLARGFDQSQVLYLYRTAQAPKKKNITLHPCYNVRGSRTHDPNIREPEDYHGANIQSPFVQLTVNITPTKCTYN